MLQVINQDWLAESAVVVAPRLIGCTLVRTFDDGTQYRGLIVETEAYEQGDPACHGSRTRTARNESMFASSGISYVYLIYGMYHCVNIVTDQKDKASAVLIRALELDENPPWIDEKQLLKPKRIAAGPGKLCRALQIDRSHDGVPLRQGEPLFLEHREKSLEKKLSTCEGHIIQTTRIGISQGKDLPWRWYLADSDSISKR